MSHQDALSVLEIRLDDVAANWLSLKKRLKAGADCAAVVKADAYGLGAREVASALYEQSCRHFFVAHFDEAAAVRGVLAEDALIYVLNGPHGASAQDFVHHNFIPVLNSPADAEYWGREAAGKPCVLHIDTGMNRLGLSAHEVAAVDLKPLGLRYVMSHLACADDPAHPLNAGQLSAFKALTGALARPLRLSLANSAGIFLGPDYHFDLARPGCALYGINPAAGPNPMRGVVTLKGKIVQIREIKEAGTVGYGATYKVSPPAKIATVSVGYADGYLRSLTGRGHVFIGKTKCPVIGRVSMDTIVVDATNADASSGYAEIIGGQQPVDEVAAQAGTIGYEILTSLGKRYKRVYTT